MAKDIRTANLSTQKGIGAEMRRIYRETRQQLIGINDGKVLMQMLRLIAEQNQGTDLADRIEALEQRTQ